MNVFSALRGPIMLIAIGIVFAADQMGSMSLGQSWPALLILFGLLKLIEYMLRRPPQEVQS